MYSFFKFLAFLLQFSIVLTSECDKFTCDECITDPNVCAWCALKTLNETIRCKPAKSLPDGWCSGFIENPISSKFIPESADKEFSDSVDDMVQIKPQMYKMKLRPGESVNFDFSYVPSKDYPVDLYFLMDASLTMKAVIDMTIKQSENIYTTLSTKTKNVYLGLGTFIDKNALPFVEVINSTATYSFMHRLNLMDNYTEFRQTLINTPFGVNRDTQEGGFDALGQVMACPLGWRNSSTKIIVFLTDGPYHTVGDGKSAGLFEPYDGGCYTNNGVYVKETEMDYPSLGMINKLATENNMVILFLVHKDVGFIYESVKNIIKGSKLETYTKTMESANLETIIIKMYEDITNNLRIQVDQKAVQNLELSFSPDCYKKHENNNLCKSKVGQKQQFTGTLSVLKYNNVDNIKVDIRIEGISEKLTLDIDVIHKCDCDNETVEHSPDCNGDTLQCGQCICSSQRYGNKCACIKNKNNLYNDDSLCFANSTTALKCSNNGNCHCGVCECYPGFSGTFCECPQAKCDECSQNIDDCVCGKCKCKKGYTGDLCQCHEDYCKANSATDKVCNDRGKCNCDSCDCEKTKEWDKRNSNDNRFCVLSLPPELHNKQCSDLGSFVLCKLEHRENCTLSNDEIRIELVQLLSEDLLNDPNWHKCDGLSVEDGCKSRFMYRYNDIIYGISIKAETEKKCAQNYLIYGGVFVFMLIMIGVGTLIGWKVITYNRDKREYKQFVDRNKQDIAEINSAYTNPCYTAPTVQFENPGFRKRSTH